MVPGRDAWVDEVSHDWRSADLSPRERALCSYAALLTHEPSQRTEADIAALRQAGLEDRAILDLVHVIGFFAHANRLADGLGCPLEKALD